MTSGLNVSTELQTTIAQGNAQVQSSTSLNSVAEAQKTTVTTALPSTTDWTAPTISSFSPADGAAGLAVSSNLTLTFGEPVQRGSGTFTLRRADGTVVEQFDAANLDHPMALRRIKTGGFRIQNKLPFAHALNLFA